MTTSFLENVNMCVLPDALTRYCMIYFGIFLQIWFLSKLNIKKLESLIFFLFLEQRMGQLA